MCAWSKRNKNVITWLLFFFNLWIYTCRSTVRSIAGTIKDKKLGIIYGSTEAEPISLITAKEKMVLEESKSEGLCVGKPAVEGSVKIIPESDGMEGCFWIDEEWLTRICIVCRPCKVEKLLDLCFLMYCPKWLNIQSM